MTGKKHKRKKANRIKRTWRRMRRARSAKVFLCFAILVGMLCIMAAQVANGSRFRKWYESFNHKDVINKSVQFGSKGDGQKDMSKGDLMSRYRALRFGATNPEEVDPNAPMVAFTFDDGPNKECTERILKVLQENYSSATFFVVGYNIEKYPDTIKNISLAGCELGNHTNDHKNLTKLSADEIEFQIGNVNHTVNELTGSKTTMIRPPEGAYDDTVMSLLEEPVVLWNLDTEDWKNRNAQMIVQNILNNVKDGDIVLMHDIYESTAEAVEMVVPMLKERGFQVVSVSELARYKGKTLELRKAYGHIEADKPEESSESAPEQEEPAKEPQEEEVAPAQETQAEEEASGEEANSGNEEE